MTARERLQQACRYYTKHYSFDKPFKTEAEFLRAATLFLETAGVLIIRQAFATKNGVSDLICCYRGKFVAFELKDDTGAPSPQQLRFISDVANHEGKAQVVDTLEQTSIVLSEILRECEK